MPDLLSEIGNGFLGVGFGDGFLADFHAVTPPYIPTDDHGIISGPETNPKEFYLKYISDALRSASGDALCLFENNQKIYAYEKKISI